MKEKQERTSTFLAELGDLPSPQDGRDTKQSHSASKTNTANESSNDTGPKCLASKTSMTSTEKTTRESPSSQVDFLANHTVTPGSEEARTMTAQSGEKWLELYRRQDPLGCLVRTLVGSRRWASTTCFLTWRAWDTPAKHSVFLLALSTPRTEGTGCGLWPTPKASSGVHRDTPSERRRKTPDLETEVKRRANIPVHVNGQLNPEFVEWLMGYPEGWTDLKD